MINIISFPKLGLSFTVNRAAFSIGNFSIYWYGLLIAAGLIIAVLYGIRESERTGLSGDDLFNMLIIALPAAIICARIYYVIFSFDMYKNDFLSIFDIRSGGLAVYGGIIGAAAVILIYCRKKKLNPWIVFDILAVGLLIGQAVGRWGNFVNGEAFGTSTSLPWAMSIKENGKTVADMVHPTFLYESLWNLLGIAVLLVYKKHKKFTGELFCGYMVWYGLGRTMIEGLRADSLYINSIRVSQMLSLFIMLCGITLIIYNRKKNKPRL